MDSKTMKQAACVLALLLGAVTARGDGRPGLPPGGEAQVMSDAYWRIWNPDEQRRIDADIERYRKADARFAIPDVDGTEVEVEQLTHDFRFGAHGFFLGTFQSEEANRTYERHFCRLFNQVTIPFYWRTFEKYPGFPHFHPIAHDLEQAYVSWGGVNIAFPDGKRSETLSPRAVFLLNGKSTDQYLDFAKFHGLRVHGHPLCWGDEQYMLPFWLYQQYCPEEEKDFLQFPLKDPNDVVGEHCGEAWAQAYRDRVRALFRNYTDAEIAARCPVFLANMKRLQARRIAEILDYCGDRVDSWDVVNESSDDWASCGRNCCDGKPFTRSRFGMCPPNYALEALRTAAAHASSHPRLSLNDWNIAGDAYPGQVRDLAAHGARIDLVGAQFHLFEDKDAMNLVDGGDYRGVSSPEGVREMFARLGVDGRPVHLSEITIPAPGGDATGRMRQAILAYNLYRAWFSQPNAWGITWWHTADWWETGAGERADGGCENGSAGVLDARLAPKPVYAALDSLVNGAWKTRARVAVRDGKAAFRGFRGAYRLAWTCSKCGRRHERRVRLAGAGVDETEKPLRALDCDVPVRRFTVDGRPVELPAGTDKIDLAALYPDAVAKGRVGTRWATVRLAVNAPADGVYTVCHFNDWFGEYSVNGGPAVAVNGPSDFPRTLALPLKAGTNEIVWRTRCGSGGKWLFGFFLRDGSGLEVSE